jgi:hypothetical protein
VAGAPPSRLTPPLLVLLLPPLLVLVLVMRAVVGRGAACTDAGECFPPSPAACS